MVVRQKGRSRLVFIPGDVDSTLWRSGHSDLSLLLRNCVTWISGGDQSVTIDGPGLIETFAWETEPGIALHVLNYTNPAAHKGWIREFHPIGPQAVHLRVPNGRRVVRAELLRAETELPVTMQGSSVAFTIPQIEDYEVAALHCI
jgi:hypothetical protein